ncbi:MAG: hypothetical protein QOE36_3168, partial [Gaiellaceae bacterium]|nr:hypothetical protein [Gaiellaceae bacterium]
MRRGLVLLGVGAALAAIAGAAAPPAAATTVSGCATNTVTVDLGSAQYVGTAVKRGASGQLLVDGTACGNVASSRTVKVIGTGLQPRLTLDLSGGPFSDGSGDMHFTDSLAAPSNLLIEG